MADGAGLADAGLAARCPVCGATVGHRPREGYEHQGRLFDLLTCGGCDSVFVLSPMKTDYTTHTADENAIRDYVELNAAIDVIGANILTALKTRRPGRLLDIGCGFGFGADIARRLAGWDVVGVEPSAYGRRGAEVLGLRMYHDLIGPAHPLVAERFEAIFSSEVIEHVDDPRAFLAMTRTMLADRGLLTVTTPDAAALDEPLSVSERLAALSPGAHLFLMSRRAMEMLLREVGFAHVEIRRRGLSIVAYASDVAMELSPCDPIMIGRDYVRDVLADGVRDESLRCGLVFRLFRYLIDLGELDEARAMLGELPTLRLDLSRPPNSIDAYMSALPANAAPLLYYKAMLLLNGSAEYAAAAELFLHAYLLGSVKLQIAPEIAAVENDLRWASLYHAGVAYRACGNEAMARTLWQVMASPPAAVPAAWSRLAVERLA